MNTSAPATHFFAGFPRPAASLAYTYDQVVSRALAQPIEQPPRGTPNTGLVTSQTVLPLVFAFLPLLALVSLVGTWYANDSYSWMPFWIFSGFGFLLYGFFLLGSWFVRERELYLRAHPVVPSVVSLAALRAAVLTGHDQVVPPIYVPTVVSHGEAPLTENQSTEPLVLSLMPPERRLLRMRQLMFWALVVPACLLSCVELFVFGSGSFGQFMPWQIAILGPLLPIELVYIFVVTNGSARPRTVYIEADGLHWGRFALPWSEMRGLCVLLLQPRRRRAALGADAIYAVFGQHASLTWYVDASNDASVNASAALLRHVQAQTGLPLRDITPGFIWIGAENQRTLGFARHKLLTVNDRTIGGIYMPSLRTALLLFCLATLVLLAGIGMPLAQQRYFGGQLARLESAQDALRDPLTSNRQQWLPAVSDFDSDPSLPDTTPPAFLFTPFGYTYANGLCCEMGSRIARPVGNVLIEVTVRQLSSDDLSGAGILFRASESNHTAYAFVVTPNGEWRLTRFKLGSDGTLIDEEDLRYEGLFGGVRPIQQGHDATNRLAVLMQGPNYTFYINGQFAGGYHADGAPQSGQVGVYTDGLADAVTFSDLLIATS